MPKVSIITPFYNGSQYIQKCIEGVQAQSFKDFEHIIVDDGSAESEHKFVSDIAVKYPGIIFISQKNSGQASAVNAGIKIAKGEYIAFCDQDDWWSPEKLKTQVDFIETHSDVDLVYSDALMADADGFILKETWMQSRVVAPCVGGYKGCVVSLFNRNFICAPLVVLARRGIFSKIGLLNEKTVSVYDYDFWFRMLEAGCKFGYIDKPLAVWRTHAGQGSRKIRTIKRLQLMILLHFLFRRPDFFATHPVLALKKLIKTSVGLMLGRTA